MKLIISHDVDILETEDHLRDFLMPKRILRGGIECILGYASIRAFFHRLVDIFNNKVHNLPELIRFDKENEVKSTFFFGMANGMYLNYPVEKARYWIRRVQYAGLDVGVHGIHYEMPEDMKKEYDTFKSITGREHFGVRMHYLRMNENTPTYLERLGYAFDSSAETFTAPYKIGGMWEFPIHIMDATLFYRNKRWLNMTFEEARRITLRLMDRACHANFPYFVVNLHDPYFSPAHDAVYRWYLWLIRYAKQNRIEFDTFHHAMERMGS